VIALLISRLTLGVWQFERFENMQSFVSLLANGFRIDLSTLGYLLISPALFHPWLMYFSKTRHVWIKALKLVFLSIFIIITFFELATPSFIHEYGFRPNRLFIEYLIYPNEVANMLFEGHLWTIIIVSLLLAFLIKLYLSASKIIFSTQYASQAIGSVSAISTFLILFLTLFLCARGTLAHRPINPSFVYFSTDPLINSLTLNSAYSVAHAYKQFGNESNAAKMYGKMAPEKVIETVRKETDLDPKSFYSNVKPSLATHLPVYQGKPKNLVIILEESLGAQFVSSLGGLPLTPAIDKLSKEGWSFQRLYATGTRSVRGIEAVITGFTPTPARAVVKLDKSQTNFFTIASLLKANNYTTQFIYGGESHFDNMKGFFLGNGIADIVDFDDIENPNFVASWGASDEDLFKQADKEITKLNESGKPFFSFIFSSSNHDPFEIPDKKVTPTKYTKEQLSKYDAKELLRHKAIQYADYALGKFIENAKKQPYWQDTVFLIVADHDARASGVELVPIKNFHIPGIILNGKKEQITDNRLISQIDLAPTLLSLIGIKNTSPMLGHDLNNVNSGGRAMMQYADNFAYIKGEDVAILQPQKEPLKFKYNFNNKKLYSQKGTGNLSEIALAHALWGSFAYKNGWFNVK